MKDVVEIVSRRLAKLETPFSKDWIADFLMLMEYFDANPLTKEIVAKIDEKKKQAHSQLLRHFSSLLKDGSTCLKQIKRYTSTNDTELHEQIKHLQQISIDSRQIADPFFELEIIYQNYYRSFTTLLKTIAQEDREGFVSKYCSLTHINLQGTDLLNVDLSFSPSLQLCQQDIEMLSGERVSSIWGKWDMLLRWEKWTKNGISPTNDTYEHNLSCLFADQKISECVQSCGS